jgi:hypothetical protein
VTGKARAGLGDGADVGRSFGENKGPQATFRQNAQALPPETIKNLFAEAVRFSA